jgi:hypothetical protein
MLPKANPHYISKKLFEEFKLKIPKEIYSYIEKEIKQASTSWFVASYSSIV